MKLKKLAIKFLTMVLSLLTLFQVGCIWIDYARYSKEFHSFEEVKSFLENDALWFFGEVYEPEEDLIFMHPIIDFAKLYTIVTSDMTENKLAKSDVVTNTYRFSADDLYSFNSRFNLSNNNDERFVTKTKYNEYSNKVAPKFLLIDDRFTSNIRWFLEETKVTHGKYLSCCFFGASKYRNDPNFSCEAHSFLKDMPTDKEYCDCMIDLFDLSKILKKGSDYVEKDLPLEVKQKEDGTFGYFWNNEEHTSCFFEDEKYILEVKNCINSAYQTRNLHSTDKEFIAELNKIYNEVYTEEKLMQLSAKILNECVHIIYAEKSTWNKKTKTVDLEFTK